MCSHVHHHGTLGIFGLALLGSFGVLLIGQPAHGFEEQLGRFGLGVKLHAGHNGAGVNTLGHQPAGIRLQWAVFANFLAEQGGGRQSQLLD